MSDGAGLAIRRIAAAGIPFSGFAFFRHVARLRLVSGPGLFALGGFFAVLRLPLPAARLLSFGGLLVAFTGRLLSGGSFAGAVVGLRISFGFAVFRLRFGRAGFLRLIVPGSELRLLARFRRVPLAGRFLSFLLVLLLLFLRRHVIDAVGNANPQSRV